MAEKPTLYLPRIQTRIGVAGYKGKNVRYIDQAPKPTSSPTDVSTEVVTKVAAPKYKAPPAVARQASRKASSR